jgi:coproporphyrinogen III oxidase-like Fe-S oxidoreductase
VRWWNVKHPAAYAGAIAAGRSPGHAREVLDPAQRRLEDILLRLRLSDGLPAELLSADGRAHATDAADQGLLEPDQLAAGRAVLTVTGRLLADGLALRLAE